MRAVADAGWETLRGSIEADVRRVSERLRSLSLARLSAGPAEASHALAQALADAVVRLEAGQGAPAVRRVPRLADLASGDQVAVLGHDLLAALDAAPATEASHAVAAEVAEQLAALRRSL